MSRIVEVKVQCTAIIKMEVDDFNVKDDMECELIIQDIDKKVFETEFVSASPYKILNIVDEETLEAIYED